MIKTIELILPPQEAADKTIQKNQAGQILSVSPERITSLQILKRSIDARSRQVKIILSAQVFIDEQPPVREDYKSLFDFSKDVSKSKPALIIGCGPAGMFAALRLIELGIKPVIIERGKDVQARRRDLAAINKLGLINSDSNYCFGEGGAGTYSDGKLYTRSKKRGDVLRVLKLFVAHGASENILVDAHPHIGTNKLPGIVQALRQSILDAGGEIHFNTKLEDFIIKDNAIRGIVTSSPQSSDSSSQPAAGATEYRQLKAADFFADAVILATGHSARDVFYLLHKRKILIESKPFALGVRMEHPQQIIDSMQYHCDDRGDYLPPASYAFAEQVEGRGVYSFCMCPGGIIAPASTDNGEIVVNGWSPSKRNNPFANSGVVVSVDEKDFMNQSKISDELSALRYQMKAEQTAFKAGGGQLKAPAQRLIDFVEGKISQTLPPCSYIPGLTSVNLNDVLYKEISSALRQSLKALSRKMKSFYTNEAILVATESRTSSPVRIPRDKESLQHPQITGLFPCGEGAGYAGGIVSAAMDGERCAEALVKVLA